MITILSGSPRKNSSTLRVARAIRNIIADLDPAQEVNIVDFNGFDIPSSNKGSVDIHHLTPWQAEVYGNMSASGLVFVLTPEYNWFPSAEIIQMLHAMGGSSFAGMWNKKVFATSGTSSGRGGRMPAVQLSYAINKVINVFSFESVVSAKMFESQFTDKMLDEDGRPLGNEEYMRGLVAFVAYNLKLADRWAR